MGLSPLHAVCSRPAAPTAGLPPPTLGSLHCPWERGPGAPNTWERQTPAGQVEGPRVPSLGTMVVQESPQSPGLPRNVECDTVAEQEFPLPGMHTPAQGARRGPREC